MNLLIELLITLATALLSVLALVILIPVLAVAGTLYVIAKFAVTGKI